MAQQPFMSKTRWLLVGDAMSRPQAYFVERTAHLKAEAIQEAIGMKVQVIRQDLRDGQWVDA